MDQGQGGHSYHPMKFQEFSRRFPGLSKVFSRNILENSYRSFLMLIMDVIASIHKQHDPFQLSVESK